MKTEHFMIILGLFLASIATANGQVPVGVPIEDKDAFEKQYIECIMSGFKNKCLATLVGRHLPPMNNHSPNDLADDLEKALQRAKDSPSGLLSIYKVHPLDKINKGGVWDIRTYAVEYSNEKYQGAYINFRKIKEKWYVSRVSLGSATTEHLRKLLELPEVVRP
jgi:hypothetical protein